MINLNNISLFFGGQAIFEDVSLMINRGDKIGLVGKNGAGKSTLLKIISNQQTIDNGDINIQKNIKIGYLKQDLEFIEGKTLIEETESAFEEIFEIGKSLEEINREMQSRKDYDSLNYMELITKFNETEEKYRMLGGHEMQSEINSVIEGLGFSKEDQKKQTSEFSGGWRMRIEIAKLLLKKPDVLLLDEPTNHLDLESIIWIENWLNNYNGAIILVSHDKIFLDSVTNKTIEISFAKINNYKASYTKYTELRKDRIEKQIQAKKNQDLYIQRTQELINKFRAKKNKAAFAQSLIKKLEKLEKIQIEEIDVGTMNFRFPPAPHSGKVSLEINNIYKKYNELTVLENVNLKINKGEKIAFVGKNGEGKSTLSKIIVNEISFKGEIKLGHKVKIGYYAQNQSELLDDNKTVFDTIYDSSNNHTSQEIRNILGSFLFSDDSIDKKVKVLSGGERARVALCKLLLNPNNLLIMDEPTNHLDIISKELLKKALLEYNGTLIMVSHDREFLKGLTEKVYEFKDQNIKEYLGDINYFLKEKSIKNINDLNTENQKKIEKKTIAKKHNYTIEKKILNNIKSLEKKIDQLENELKKIDVDLQNPEKYKILSQESDFFKKYEEKSNLLKELENQWENENVKLEKINTN